MPGGFQPELIINNPVDREFQNSLTESFQQFGKDLRTGIERLAANRQTRELGEELSRLNPESPFFAQQMTSAITRNPLGAQSKAGLAAINVLGDQHKSWLNDSIERQKLKMEQADRQKWDSFIKGGGGGLGELTNNPAFNALGPAGQQRTAESYLKGENRAFAPRVVSGNSDQVLVDPRTGESKVLYDSLIPEARQAATTAAQTERERAAAERERLAQLRIDEAAQARREANEAKLITEERLSRSQAQAQANRIEAQNLKKKAALEKELESISAPNWPWKKDGKMGQSSSPGAERFKPIKEEAEFNRLNAIEQAKADKIQAIKNQLAEIDKTSATYADTEAVFQEADLPKWTEYDRLPSGAIFVDPEGKKRKKP